MHRIISFTYFFKERTLGCLSSRFSCLNFKECALRCESSRFLCALSSNSNGLFGLWTWNVVNGKNVNIFDDLYLDASYVLGSLYYSKLSLLLWVVIQLLSYILFIFGFLTLLSLSFPYHYLFFSFLIFSFLFFYLVSLMSI